MCVHVLVWLSLSRGVVENQYLVEDSELADLETL